MLHEMNQMPDVHTLNVNDNFNGAQNNRGVDSDFSVMPDNNMVDPGFSVMPDNNMIDPDFSVFPDNDVIDPDFSVMPDNGVIDPDFSVPPVWFPGGPGPVIPCGNCLPMPQPTRGFSIRFLNASPVHSNLTIQVDNRTILTNMDFAEVSRYRQYSRGFHRITIMAPDGLVYLQQNMFFGYNSTIAIVSIQQPYGHQRLPGRRLQHILQYFLSAGLQPGLCKRRRQCNAAECFHELHQHPARKRRKLQQAPVRNLLRKRGKIRQTGSQPALYLY